LGDDFLRNGIRVEEGAEPEQFSGRRVGFFYFLKGEGEGGGDGGVLRTQRAFPLQEFSARLAVELKIAFQAAAGFLNVSSGLVERQRVTADFLGKRLTQLAVYGRSFGKGGLVTDHSRPAEKE